MIYWIMFQIVSETSVRLIYHAARPSIFVFHVMRLMHTIAWSCGAINPRFPFRFCIRFFFPLWCRQMMILLDRRYLFQMGRQFNRFSLRFFDRIVYFMLIMKRLVKLTSHLSSLLAIYMIDGSSSSVHFIDLTQFISAQSLDKNYL